MVTMVDISSMQIQNYVLRQLQSSTTAIESVFAKPSVSTHGHLWLWGKIKVHSNFSNCSLLQILEGPVSGSV
jgi:hypothetical protein